jgi:hypothetical protein
MKRGLIKERKCEIKRKKEERYWKNSSQRGKINAKETKVKAGIVR